MRQCQHPEFWSSVKPSTLYSWFLFCSHNLSQKIRRSCESHELSAFVNSKSGMVKEMFESNQSQSVFDVSNQQHFVCLIQDTLGQYSFLRIPRNLVLSQGILHHIRFCRKVVRSNPFQKDHRVVYGSLASLGALDNHCSHYPLRKNGGRLETLICLCLHRPPISWTI